MYATKNWLSYSKSGKSRDFNVISHEAFKSNKSLIASWQILYMRCFTWIASFDHCWLFLFWSHNRLSCGGFTVSKTNNDMYPYSPQLQKCSRWNVQIWNILWLALLAKYIFSIVFRCQFTPLLTKRLWDPPLLFTPIPSKSSFRLTSYLDNRLSVWIIVKTAQIRNGPGQNGPNPKRPSPKRPNFFGQNGPTFFFIGNGFNLWIPGIYFSKTQLPPPPPPPICWNYFISLCHSLKILTSKKK